MIAWRIEKAKYAETSLEGIGSAKKPGRWNVQGQPVVYAAEHPALCLLEIMVHLEVDYDELPPYQLLQFDIPDDSVILQHTLPKADSECQAIGSAWLTGKQSLVLRVPSVILPHSHNLLINPAHPRIQEVRPAGVEPIEIDPRLLHSN